MFDQSILVHHLEPLRALLDADAVTELVINKPFEVGIEGRGGWDWVNNDKLSVEWLETLSTSMANYTKQKVGPQTPICSTSLPTGERVQIVAPPACDLGLYSITIRKPSIKTFGLD